MEIVSLLLNLIMPGTGTMVLGKITPGFIQFLLYWFGCIILVTLSPVIGVTMALVSLFWALVTTVEYFKENK